MPLCTQLSTYACELVTPFLVVIGPIVYGCTTQSLSEEVLHGHHQRHNLHGHYLVILEPCHKGHHGSFHVLCDIHSSLGNFKI